MEIFDRSDQFQAALQSEGGVELLVTDRGPFCAHLTRVALPQLCLLRGEEFQSRIAVVSVAPNSLLVVLPIGPGSSQIWGGARMQAGEIMTVSPGGLVHAHTSGPCRWEIICLPVSALTPQRPSPIVVEFLGSPGVRRWRPAGASIQSLTKHFNAAIHLAEASDEPDEAAMTYELEFELIRALIDCLCGEPIDSNVTTRQRHAAIMARVEHSLRIRPDRIPIVTEVCGMLGISQRTLLMCCREQVGMGPSRYFRLGRMMQVRRALISTQPGSASVSQLARSHGFNELGRFAGAYRRFFGELPSASLRTGGVSARQRRRTERGDAAAPQTSPRCPQAKGWQRLKRPTAQ